MLMCFRWLSDSSRSGNDRNVSFSLQLSHKQSFHINNTDMKYIFDSVKDSNKMLMGKL